ncbi:MAG: TonB-dependent receptor [Bacteroidota bacterium]
MKKRLPVLLVAIFSFTFVFSQTNTLTGRVAKENSTEGIPGVSVLVKGTKTATSTNESGNFTIAAPSGATLVFSSVGYKLLEVSVGGRAIIDVSMTEEAAALNDVVVVGYATVRRKDLTGSVSSIGAKQLKDIPLSSAAEALQGRLAGVSVLATEGAPGAEIVIRVRGGSSITQDNSPLYIVDGVQVENALNVISPQDIASVDVLKDASTTAIYGVRGANGVMIITTKSGRSGKTRVNYSGSFGWRKLPQTQEVLSPYDFVLWQYERSRGSIPDSTDFARTYGTTWDTLSNYKNVPAINWQEEVFGRKAKYSNHNVSINGGDQNTSFNLSLTANNEEGIQLQSGFDRKIAAFRLDHKISNRLKTGISIRYIDQLVKGSGTTNGGTRSTNRLRHTINYRPFELPTPTGGIDDFDEAYFLASSGATNPVLLTNAEYRRQQSKGTYLSGYLSFNILKNLVLRSTFGYNVNNARTDLFYSRITSTARQFASLPVASVNDVNISAFNNSNTLQYTLNNIKEHHDVTVLVGQEILDARSKSNFVETRYFPFDISPEKALGNMGLGSVPPGTAQPLPISFVDAPSKLFSVFGRVTYGFDDKYLATFNVRSDRSSKFASENNTIVSPSGSVAWRISREKFMQNIGWISDAKIRYGYGALGNNQIGNLLYRQLYNTTGQYALNHSILPGFFPNSLSNPLLKWETNITSNFGIDLSLFNNRIQFTTDIYRNTANDLLLAVQVPPTLGYTTQLQNIGSTINKGIEFQINAIPVQNQNFTWNSNFNISFNRNEVKSLGGVSQVTRNSGWQGSDGVDDYLVKVGEPLGLMYGFVTDGFYKVDDFTYNPTTAVYTIKPGIPVNGVYGTPQPGMLKWKDIDGDGAITADKDRQVIGNANPNFIGGWNNQFTYKGFDLSVFVNFVVGNDVYNANKLEWTDGAFGNLNMLNIMKTRWTNIDPATVARITDPVALTKLNENATIWSPVRVQRWWLHSWAVEDGSYLRFNNLTVGYTLPSSLTQKAKISSLRFYATVNNLGTITNYSGFDPDVTARRSDPLTPGVDFAAYPRSRSYVFGVNLSF